MQTRSASRSAALAATHKRVMAAPDCASMRPRALRGCWHCSYTTSARFDAAALPLRRCESDLPSSRGCWHRSYTTTAPFDAATSRERLAELARLLALLVHNQRSLRRCDVESTVYGSNDQRKHLISTVKQDEVKASSWMEEEEEAV